MDKKKGGHKVRPYIKTDRFVYSSPRFLSSGSILGSRPRKRL